MKTAHTLQSQLHQVVENLSPVQQAEVLVTNPFILDGRNFLDQKELERLGYRYIGIGR